MCHVRVIANWDVPPEVRGVAGSIFERRKDPVNMCSCADRCIPRRTQHTELACCPTILCWRAGSLRHLYAPRQLKPVPRYPAGGARGWTESAHAAVAGADVAFGAAAARNAVVRCALRPNPRSRRAAPLALRLTHIPPCLCVCVCVDGPDPHPALLVSV